MHQQPLVGLVAVDGEALTAADVEREFREKLGVLVAEYVPLLKSSRSPWLAFALVIAAETGGAMAQLMKVV